MCDEPVSALDVSIQAQILNLMKQLQSKMGLTYMFITHDLSVVNHFSDDIAVMYLGKLIEKAPSEELFAHPTHPYTQALLSAIPIPSLDNRRERILLKGEITSAHRAAEGMPFCEPVSVCNGPLPLGGAAAEGDQPRPLRVLLPYRLGFIRPELFYGSSGLFALYLFGTGCGKIWMKEEA